MEECANLIFLLFIRISCLRSCCRSEPYDSALTVPSILNLPGAH